MIWFDRTSRSIVSGCTACGPTCREVFNTQREADNWALGHIARAHPEPTRDRGLAITASRVRRHRDT